MIAQMIEMEPEYAVQLVLTHHDDPREFHFAWQGEGYKMVLAFPMEEFDWPNPLLLCGEGLAYEDVEEILRGICLEEREADSIPVIMERFRNVTAKAFGDFAPDRSRDEENRRYAGILDEMLHAYVEEPAAENYELILCHVFKGIADGNKLPVLVDVDPENHNVGPLFIGFEDGTQSLAVMTDPEEDAAVAYKIRALIRECEKNGNCDGLLFNYGKDHCVHLPLKLIQAAIRAGRQIEREELE